jgi:hypothetical protein
MVGAMVGMIEYDFGGQMAGKAKRRDGREVRGWANQEHFSAMVYCIWMSTTEMVGGSGCR